MCRTSSTTIKAQTKQEHPEGSPMMTWAVVAPGEGTEHRSPEAKAEEFVGRSQLPLAARHRVPNGERLGSRRNILKENPAMAAVQQEVFSLPPIGFVGDARGKFRGGEEMRGGLLFVDGEKKAQHRRRSMKVAVPAAEGCAGEEGEPELAGEGGAHQARGLVRRKAEEDLLEQLLRQRGRRCQRRRGFWGSESFRSDGKF